MLIQYFKKNSPSSFILLPLFGLILWLFGFFSKQNNLIIAPMPLYETMANPLNTFHSLATFIAFLLIITEAFLLNFIVNKFEILSKPSFLPALFYIVFMSNDLSLLTVYPFLFAAIFIMLGIYKLVSSYQKDKAFSNAFDAGILISMSTLFYFQSIVFIPLLAIGLVLFRPFNWREWVISLLGITVPYIFVFTYYFWNDLSDYWWNVKILFQGIDEPTKIAPSASFYFMLTISALIVVFSSGKLFTGFYEATQKNKKGIILLLWFSVLGLISAFIAPQISIRSFTVLSIPLSVFCANYFLKIKKQWWGELLFILLLVSIFFNQFFNL